MSSLSEGKIKHYIQTTLYDGRKPNENGYYCYSRKELAENTGLSPSTVVRNMDEVLDYFSKGFRLDNCVKFSEYPGESLYCDVSYVQGVLSFKRNPLTFKPELSFLWGLPPLYYHFAYDCFDDKHRRRHNGGKMIFDSIPWSWDADKYEDELRLAREAIRQHQLGITE